MVAYYLLDDKGNEICRASVLDVQTVQVGGQPAVVPKHVKLVWRPQQIEMSMRLYRHGSQQIDAHVGGEAVQPGRPAHPGGQPGQGAGCAERRVAGYVDSTDAAERAGEVDAPSEGREGRVSEPWLETRPLCFFLTLVSRASPSRLRYFV